MVSLVDDKGDSGQDLDQTGHRTETVLDRTLKRFLETPPRPHKVKGRGPSSAVRMRRMRVDKRLISVGIGSPMKRLRIGVVWTLV